MINKTSFFIRIFLSLSAVIVIAIAVPAYYFSDSLEENLIESVENKAFEKLDLISLFFDFEQEIILSSDNYDKLGKTLASQDLRLTLIRNDGEVLYDTGLNSKDIAGMDNHLDRIEIKEAIKSGKGTSVRHSNTLEIDFIYVAKLLDNGYILRLAFPQTEFVAQKDSVEQSIIVIFLIGLMLSLLLALWFSYRIKNQLKNMVDVVEAISYGKYKSRLHHVPGQEFATLARAVNRMARNIEKQLIITKEQSAQLQVIFDTMNDGILLLDNQGFVKHSNKALRSLCPTIPDGDAIPENLKIPVIECIASPILQNSVDKLLGLTSVNQQNNQSTKDNACYLEIELFQGRHFALALAKPENFTDNMALVIVLHEITDLVRLETVRKDFVANVSHELRTPLTAIQGYAETIESMAELPEDSRRFAQIIHKHGSYLNTMIEDLLALARIENPNENFMLSQVYVLEALNTAITFCNKLIQNNNLTFTIEMDQNLMVLAEKSQLERVFRNLLENACRYSLPDSSIKISAITEGDLCIFAVENRGVYISPEHIERIFERFYRVEKDRSNINNNGAASTGLGLAICKHIIDRHGGSIRAVSTKQDGYGVTTFIFTLFLAKPTTEINSNHGENNV